MLLPWMILRPLAGQLMGIGDMYIFIRDYLVLILMLFDFYIRSF